MKTIGILPVKRLDTAHSRLAGLLNPDQRQRLAEATFLDALGKIRQCRTLDETIVVTADPSVERQARWLGHLVVLQEEDAGHPAAASAGARAAMELAADRVVMLPTDCPLLDPAEVDDRLGQTVLDDPLGVDVDRVERTGHVGGDQPQHLLVGGGGRGGAGRGS